MTVEEQRDLRRRAKAVLHAPIPSSIRNGSANAAAEFKDSCAVVQAFMHRGTQQEKAKLAILRLEGVQGRL